MLVPVKLTLATPVCTLIAVHSTKRGWMPMSRAISILIWYCHSNSSWLSGTRVRGGMASGRLTVSTNGPSVGALVGRDDSGLIVGSLLIGLSVGAAVGKDEVGTAVGAVVGSDIAGMCVGVLVGLVDAGCAVGPLLVGLTVGAGVGRGDAGEPVGAVVGPDVDGESVGVETVGDAVIASSHRVQRWVVLASYLRTQRPRHRSTIPSPVDGTVSHAYGQT